MSRYTGPRVKKMRKLGVNLPGLSRKTMDRRPYPPGEHGGKRQKRKSDYANQLMEKQKLRLNYGVSERQFRRYMVEARQSKTPTGDKLLELLERRLDNVVFRAGFAPTIPAARQLVNHRHIRLNGHKADIPSIRVKVGDVIVSYNGKKIKSRMQLRQEIQKARQGKKDEVTLVVQRGEQPTDLLVREVGAHGHREHDEEDDDPQSQEELIEEAVTELIDRDPELAKRLQTQFKKLAKA